MGCQDGKIRAFAQDGNTPYFELDGHDEDVTSIIVGELGNLISGSRDRTAKVWSDRRCEATLSGHSDALTAVAEAEGGVILTASKDKSIKIYDKDATELHTLSLHKGVVTALAVFLPRQFLSAGDTTIRHWNIKGDCLGTFYGSENEKIYHLHWVGI